MRNRKIIYLILIGLFVVSLVLAGIIFYSRSQELRVIFLDVGQGDAILIEQGGRQILIDGGPSGQVLMDKIGRYVPFWDRKIEMVIATHPDADHITGLVDALEKYSIGAVMETGATSDSQIFKKMEETIQEKDIRKIAAERGEKINLGNVAAMEILSPGPETPISTQDTNAASIVAKLISGDNSFLFTGDLPSEQEIGLIKSQTDLKADILKISHHGSKYATSAEFLEAVQPQEAVISVGRNNRYGHPAPEILERLKNKNIKIWRTDESGDIEYVCPNPETDCAMVAN